MKTLPCWFFLCLGSLLVLAGCDDRAENQAIKNGDPQAEMPVLTDDPSDPADSSASDLAEPVHVVPVDFAGRWRRHSEVTGLTSETIRALWMNAEGTEGWATGNGGVVLHYVDGNWSVDESASALTNYHLDSLAMSHDGSEGWAGGGGNPLGFGNAVFIHFADGAWQACEQEFPHHIPEVSAIDLSKDGKSGWAVTMHGFTLRLAEGLWSVVDKEIVDTKGHLAVTEDASRGWLLGPKGSVEKLADGKWSKDEEASSFTDGPFTALWVNAEGTAGWAAMRDRNLEKRKADMYQLLDGKWIKHPAGAWHNDQYTTVTSIWMNEEATEGWAGLSNGAMLQFADGKWEEKLPSNAFGRKEVRRLTLSPSGERGCALVGGKAFYHLEEGQWKLYPLPERITERDLETIWMNAEGTVGWAGGNRTLLRYADGEWTAVETNVEYEDIWLNDDGTEGWAVGEQGGGVIYRFENGAWTEAERFDGSTLKQLELSADGTTGWAARYENVWQLVDGKWQRDEEASALVTANPLNMWLNAEGDEGWMVGERIMLRLKGGKWQSDQAASKLVLKCSAIAFSAEQEKGWTDSDRTYLLRYTSGGWQEHKQEPYFDADQLYEIKMTADFNSGMGVGRRGEIVRYIAGGWHLDPDRKSVSADLNDLWLKADGSEGWAVGERGEILRFSLAPPAS